MTHSVLFLCKKRVSNYGVSTGLLNSSQFIANHLIKNKVPAKVVECIDANSIDREVHLYKPTHVVISAIWVTPAKLNELVNKYKNIQWQVRVHSKVPFIANEGIAFEWLLEYTKIDRWNKNLIITGNSLEFCKALEFALNIECIHLPNIYKPDYKPTVAKPVKDKFIDVGCFGAIRPMKNQLIQAMAAIAFANKSNLNLRFHINAQRTEQSGEQVLKNIRALFKDSRHKLIEHAWMSHEDFLKLIKTMDMGLQVSLTETFNIVAADFVYMGIPIIVSDEIQWMDDYYKVDPLDIQAIASKMFDIYVCPPLLRSRWSIYKLGRYNKKAGAMWLEYLNRRYC